MALTTVGVGLLSSTSQYTGFKNRIINGGMVVSQRATSATVTAGTAVPTASTGYPVVDRFFVYSTGANVTAAQVAGSGAVQNRLQITGAASVTAIGIGQRIEQSNSYDLAGSTATLSLDISNSLLTTVTWTASYATTANTFGTIGTPTKTQIATGTFTVTSTLTNYNAQIAIPAAATTGVEILLTVGAQTSGTWVVGAIQLEKGLTATSFDYRDYGRELIMCQRYYEKSFSQGVAPNNSGTGLKQIATSASWGSGAGYTTIPLKVVKRVIPAVTNYGNASGYLGYTAAGNLPTTETVTNYSINLSLSANDDSSLAITNNVAQLLLFNIYGGWAASAEL